MKQFKKLVAALLVGVMALALFTACGKPAPSDAELAEVAILAAMNEKRSEDDQLENSMKAMAEEALAKVSNDGKINPNDIVRWKSVVGSSETMIDVTYVFVGGVNFENIGTPDGSVSMNALPYGDKLMGQVVDLAKMAPAMSEFGVAVDEDAGYVAVSFEIDAKDLSGKIGMWIKAWIGAHTPSLYD